MAEKQRVPFWLAVPITVLISLPFGTLLGKYNLALWTSFIVWAEYFALGAKPSGLRTISIAFPLGAFWGAISGMLINYTTIYLGWNLLLSVALWLFIWIVVMVYLINVFGILQNGSLAYFNGLSMYLAFYFVDLKSGLGAGPLINNPLIDPWIYWIWVSLAGIFGGLLGWLNVVLTFPKKVEK